MALDLLPTLSSMLPTNWVLLTFLAVIVYLYAWGPYRVFRKMGVPGPPPLPFIGNNYLTVFAGFYNTNYSAADMGPVVGFFNGLTPALVVSDPEMMRDIFVKKFHCFTNRQPDAQLINVKPASRMIINLKGEEWKNVRATLSPAFSSNKLRQMVDSANTCADQLVENMSNFGATKESFDVKELTSAFSMDVIARTVFGIEINTQQNPQDPFVVHSKNASNPKLSDPLIMLWIMFPALMKPILELFKCQLFFPRKSTDFYDGVMDQILAMRKTDGGKGRVDMMQVMIDAHKEKDDDSMEGDKVQGKKQPLTRDDVVANGIGFFTGSYDTVSITMSFTLYQLALHQEIQDKVRQEINDVSDIEDLVDYEAVQKMSYLEMCVMETLRLYPLVGRVASEEVKLKWLTVPKGMFVAASPIAIHYDPRRWPEPRKYIPERFTKEEREKRDPYDWLPFGAGPRNCIGMRLALMEIKVGLAKVLMKYRVMTGPDTEVPVKLNKWRIMPTPVTPIRLRVEPLDHGSN